ncbi:hypothetical protein JW935_11495 [candidate division KSB1 bacterium]|nr:hypothetical protein [candidate division KSB1 bacterium]
MTGGNSKQQIVSIDAKWRVLIPVHMRHALMDKSDKKVIVVQGGKEFISIYKPERWNEVEKSLVKAAEDSNNMEWLERVVLSTAAEKSFDQQGRVKLDGILVRRAKLKGKTEALVIGLKDHVEIWDYENFESQREAEAPYVFNVVKNNSNNVREETND